MLKTLDITNFTCFPKAKLEFSPGLNVIVGENGTGKSHLLKLGYAVLQGITACSNKSDATCFYALKEKLEKVFGVEDLSTKARRTANNDFPRFEFKAEFYNGNTLDFIAQSQSAFLSTKNRTFAAGSALYIPPKELISVYRGFESTLRNRELRFDDTYLDLLSALGLPPLKGEALSVAEHYCKPIEHVMQQTLFLDDEGDFSFLHNKDGVQYSLKASVSAEGHNKLGMFICLLKNGAIGQDSSLFFDEPEANINSKLLSVLAKALASLSSIMQITIATHSLFLLRELDICLHQKGALPNKAIFTGLHMQDDGSVSCIQSEEISKIGDIAALDASLEQTDRYMAVRNV